MSYWEGQFIRTRGSTGGCSIAAFCTGLTVQLEKIGYHVEEARYPLGVSVLILSASPR